MSMRKCFWCFLMMLAVSASAVTAISQTLPTHRSAKKAAGTTTATTHNSLTPAAEFAAVSGRVRTSTGDGIAGAAITVTGGSLTAPISVRAMATGDYIIPALRVGATYVVSVKAKHAVFNIPARPLSLLDDVSNFDFVASQP